MCGLVGIYARQNVNQNIFDALMMLQHRGQDGAGMATAEKNSIYLRSQKGLVSEVFHRPEHLLQQRGNLGIGHVRYPTAGSEHPNECQPFYINSPYGIALAHNGTINNTDALKEELRLRSRYHINTNSDSEILLNYLAYCLERAQSDRLEPQSIFAALELLYGACRGGYAVVCLLAGVGLLAFRDKHGIRPLILGSRPGVPNGTEYMFASESVALQAQGFTLMRDLDAGEAVLVTEDGTLHRHAYGGHKSPCIFEYVYFARPDSVLDGISVHKARQRMGVALSQEVQKKIPQGDIDVVVPVPDSSRVAAVEVALKLDINYREGLVKNRYIGRTFIMPYQKMRTESVRRKLSIIDFEFRKKNVLLVDDSIIRGTTCRQIIAMARRAGANKVYFASAAPPVRYPNVYGIDMPSQSEFVAYDRDEDHICEYIGADELIYQRLTSLIQAVQSDSKRVKHFDCSVFDGQYVTGDITQEYLHRLNRARRDESRTQIEIFTELESAYY